jgi:hypothetical protein
MGTEVGSYPNLSWKAVMSEGLSSLETKTPSRLPSMSSSVPREPAYGPGIWMETLGYLNPV